MPIFLDKAGYSPLFIEACNFNVKFPLRSTRLLSHAWSMPIQLRLTASRSAGDVVRGMFRDSLSWCRVQRNHVSPLESEVQR
ncbi:MAG: hypothetical protein RIC55_24195, partial [Pirellulaceae bacterium]